jgi:hypothetical protein
MSDTLPHPDADPKPARPLNRWGLGTLSLLQLILMLLIVVALNYLSTVHYTRFDLSRQGDYTLANSSERYLEETVAKREKPVKWIMAFRRSSPFYERVRALSEEYARKSDGKIELEILDPLRSPERTQQVMAAFELSFLKDMIIFDARTDDGEAVKVDATGFKRLNPNVKVAIADEMVVHRSDQQGQRRPSGFQGEGIMTSRLVEAIEGRPRRMLFLADKSTIDPSSENDAWKSLEQTMRFQNIELTPVRFSEIKEVPEEVEGLALIAPRYDLTDEELAVLETYWNKPKAALLFLLKAGDTPPKLRAFLRGNGVTPRRDRIITREEDKLVTTARGVFTPLIDFTSDLANQSVVYDGASSSLEVREGAPELLDRKISAFSLIEISPQFWGETRFGAGGEAFDETEDHPGPLTLAASVTRGAASDDRFAADTSRMMILANTDFLDPDRQRAENIDFLSASVNWLMGRETLAGIGPRSFGTYKLPLLDAQVTFINRVNLFFLPALIFLIGGIIWSSRRA